ncbi:MAG TPA: hypothetical protein VLT45_01140 [Kofleriaceae bacterium]|nr:hypothetical protein [Kofleriaceae bacterium]
MDDTRDTEPMEIPVFQEPDEMCLDVGDRRQVRAITSSEWPPEPQPPARTKRRRAGVYAIVRRLLTSS